MNKPYSCSWQKMEHGYTKRTEYIGDRIKAWLIQTGTTQAELTRACNVYGRHYGVNFSKSIINSYVHNRCTPKMDNMTVLCKVMGVSTSWLCGYGSSKLIVTRRVAEVSTARYNRP